MLERILFHYMNTTRFLVNHSFHWGCMSNAKAVTMLPIFLFLQLVLLVYIRSFNLVGLYLVPVKVVQLVSLLCIPHSPLCACKKDCKFCHSKMGLLFCMQVCFSTQSLMSTVNNHNQFAVSYLEMTLKVKR